jgi:hypothetical protein
MFSVQQLMCVPLLLLGMQGCHGYIRDGQWSLRTSSLRYFAQEDCLPPLMPVETTTTTTTVMPRLPAATIPLPVTYTNHPGRVAQWLQEEVYAQYPGGNDNHGIVLGVDVEVRVLMLIFSY